MPRILHRLSHTAEYRSWHAMMQRCNDPKNNRFRYYGGRGISVCERWRNSFEAFLADMGKKPTADHTIERINSDGNYEQLNCRWIPRGEQSKNRPNFRAHTTKLTPDDVRAIRADARPKARIAKQYGISGRQVLAVQRRECWAHIS